jgi:TonB-dependent receptor
MRHLFLGILMAFSSLAFSQNGTIRGTVIEDETGYTVIGSNVVIADPLTGSSTDLDGKFSIPIAPGTYVVKVSFISFQTVTITDVIVTEGQVTSLGTVRLKSAAIDVGEVVITATATRKSEAALNSMKKKSIAMKDGISSEKLALTGDGNVAEAAKRVTGVSIEGGKYIYVRGLGDRYSKVTLNQVDIPGLDPDKNSLQMDIFPTNLIDNIIVSKNFTADMPADFAGGILNVETKSFPEEKIMAISASIGYNPSMHLNSDYLNYEGSSTDFLGFDNGTRANPDVDGLNIPNPIDPRFSANQVNNFVNEFDKNLAAQRATSLMDYSLGYTIGDQIDLKNENKLGYTFSISYKTDYTYYDEVINGEFQRDQDGTKNELINTNLRVGEVGEKSVLIGAIGGLAYKTKFSKYRLSILRLQTGVSSAGKFEIENFQVGAGTSGFIATSDVLQYNQRSLNNLLINGVHVLKQSGWEIDWRISPTYSTSDDPDLRYTAFTNQNDRFVFNSGDGGFPTRIWRSLNEINVTGKVDATKDYKIKEMDSRFLTGVNYTYKQRDYSIIDYELNVSTFSGSQSWEGNDADQVLNPSNVFPKQSNEVFYQTNVTEPNYNAYESSIQNFAFYASNEFTLTNTLKAIVGLRLENFAQWHTGRSQSFVTSGGAIGRSLNNEVVLESTNLFPSLNIIYNVAEEQNLRFAYAKTIARPSFKELSFAEIQDPVTGRSFNGGLFAIDTWDGNLKSTDIDNIDFRWEKFMERGQIISASLFYKRFINPIELVRLPVAQTNPSLQPRNVGEGQVYGIEVEVTKSLSFINEGLEEFGFSGNITLVKSQIEMTDIEFDARKIYEKEGENIDRKRDMAGQAPFVINAGLSYKNIENAISAGIFYNVKGPTLTIVGTGLIPDVYQVPFHSLNFSVNKKLGKERKTTVDLKIGNILSDKRELVFKSFEAEDQIFNSFNPGTTISAGISHKF